MIIDIGQAQNAFKEYAKKYNPEDEKIKIKIAHIQRVAQNSKRIAQNLKLSQEDIELAELIGLLHDIGRFEQVRLYHTFVDKDSINHGEYGVKILFEDGLIRKFINDDRFDQIIKLAIINHNRADIEEGLTEREILHAKIIRDADKTDNFVIKQYQDFRSLFKSTDKEVEKEKITDTVWNEFLQERIVISSHRVTNMDKWISHIAWVYDYNFPVGLKYLKENDCVNKIIDRLDYKDEETKERMEYARKKVSEYIDKKLAED